MADWVAISEVATAGGTMILAVATFSSVRSASASTKLAERSLMATQRPLLLPSNVNDPSERIRFGDDVIVDIVGHKGGLKIHQDGVYMALSLRNGGAGLAVIHSWHIFAEPVAFGELSGHLERPADVEQFRRQQRDLYIPAGSTGFWQGAIRDSTDPDNVALRTQAAAGARIFIDLLYGDMEGGQRCIARFGLPTDPDDNDGRVEVIRYWAIDGVDPR
jgi:hypothetical protein